MELVRREQIRGVDVGVYRCGCSLTTRAVVADVDAGIVQSCGHRHAAMDPRLLFLRRFGVELREKDLPPRPEAGPIQPQGA